MGQIDDETMVRAWGDGRYAARLSASWNIGDNPNGGYAVLPALRAMLDRASTVATHPDPLSLTVHFLRPTTGDRDAEVTARVVRAGRSVTNATAALDQDGTARLVAHAVLGDLGDQVGAASHVRMSPQPPDLPPPDVCADRRVLAQGVDLPILSRLDVRLRPEHLEPDASRPAVVEGWVRFADRTEPQACWLPLFADAFPPALCARFGFVGWAPTIELTVHVRRRPAPGWVAARFECDDVDDAGRMIETGTLWDSTGEVVARSRQLAIVRPS